MSTTLEILSPNRQVKLRNGAEVTVRELSWREQKQVMDRILAQIGKVRSGIDGGKLSLSLDLVTEAVKESTELSEFLIEKTTAMGGEKIGELALTEFFAVLEQAVDLNISIYMEGTKKTFGRITSFAGVNAARSTPTTASPAASSS